MTKTVQETEDKILHLLLNRHPQGMRHIEIRKEITGVSSRDIMFALVSLTKQKLITREAVNARKVYYNLNLKAYKQHVMVKILANSDRSKEVVNKIMEKMSKTVDEPVK